MSQRWQFSAELWRWDGDAAWHFVSVPEAVADEIADRADRPDRSGRGFGSVRVEVTVGTTVWLTSVFPDSARGTYVLPVKRSVRTAEGLDAGDAVDVDLRLVG